MSNAKPAPESVDPPGHRSSPAPRRVGRLPPPSPPTWPRPEWKLLDEVPGALGVTLWQAVRDVLLWNRISPGERAELFAPPSASTLEQRARAVSEAPEMAGALGELEGVAVAPEVADKSRVLAACEQLWKWAESRGLHETAIQFAEAAARLEMESSSRAYTAGRLCRAVGDHQRAVVWFHRAARLARLAEPPSEIEFATAHLGWGILEHDRRNFLAAEWHFLKARGAALQRSNHSLAAAAHHNLLLVCLDAGRTQDAVKHAAHTIDLYPRKHPRIPVVACDIGYLWMKLGYFSAAIYLFSRSLRWMLVPGERAIVLAFYARSAAAVRDRIRFERLSERAAQIVAQERQRADTVLYHLGEGARSFEQWDRAQTLATEARSLARARGNGTMVSLAERLLEEVTQRKPGDVDTIPEEGGNIDRITRLVLRKLRSVPAPESLDSGTALFPEYYPLD